MSTTDAPQPQPKKVSRRYFLIIAVACAVLFGWYYLRGSWATANPVEPTTPEQGVFSRLVIADDGEQEIRTSVLLPVPIATAWKILSNYAEWERLFKTVRKKPVTEQVDENHIHVVSDVTTPLGVMSLDFVVTHEKTPDGGYLAWWDAPTKQLPVNRGSMRLIPKGPEQTLFVYTVRKRYQIYPQFFVNNLLFGQQADLVRTLKARMLEISGES